VVNKRKILQSAQKHLQKGALDRALKDYQSLLEVDPRDANVRLKVGDLHLRRGETAPAIDAYLKVAAQFMGDGFDAKAVAIYKQVTRIDARRHDVYEPLAELYQRMGLGAEAMAALQAAADAHHRAGRRREALELLRRMASLDPANAASRLKVAELLRQERLAEEAVVEYREAAAELERQGDAEGAAAALERALELGAGAELRERAARLRLRSGQAERAEALARGVVEAEPDAPGGWELLAEIHQEAGRERELTEVYRRLAEVYRKRGDEERARSILQRFVPVEPFAEGREELGSFEAALGGDAALGESLAPDFGEGGVDLELDEDLTASAGDGARPLALEGSEAEPPAPPQAPPAGGDLVEGDAQQLLAEANVYLRYGKLDRALACLRALLAREPGHLLGLEKLAEAQVALGDSAAAAAAYARAASLARETGEAERFEALRGRLASLDPAAAQAFGSAAVGGPAPAGVEVAAGEEYLDEDVEFSIDAPDAGPGPDAHATQWLDPTGATSATEIELDDEAAPTPEDAQSSPEPAPPPPGLSPALLETLAEARFYAEHGLREEAEASYRRVLEAAPGHPEAAQRLGELARARERSRVAPAPALRVPAAASAAHELAQDAFGLDEEGFDPFADEPDAPHAAAPAGAPPPSTSPSPAPPPEAGPAAPAPRAAEPAPGKAERSAVRAAPAQAEVTLPGVGDGAFDLAAELSEALGSSPARDASTEGEGFTALFQEFKRGVLQTLRSGDGESRYDLGIAYREMGLLEDALEEFRAALHAPARRLDALHMLAVCSLDLGRAQEVLALLEETLAGPELPESHAAILHFDLGRVHEALGQCGEALGAYRRAAHLDVGCGEVGERIAALEERGGTGAEPAPPETEPVPRYESFEDLVAEADATGEPAPEPAAPEGAEPPAAEAREPETERPRPRRKRISFF
jgi:tetratricopeptide (TPR) repeat protein